MRFSPANLGINNLLIGGPFRLSAVVGRRYGRQGWPVRGLLKSPPPGGPAQPLPSAHCRCNPGAGRHPDQTSYLYQMTPSIFKNWFLRFVLAFFSFFPILGKAQTENQIFEANILSPEVHPPNEPLLPPIVEWNSEQQLEISFDDLNHDTRDLSYRVIHCTAQWEKSDLLFMQYMQGFESQPILDYAFSNNTTTPYTRYWFLFPNESMRPILPGNYLIQVFPTDNPEQLLFQQRCFVLQPSLKFSASVRNASSARIRLSHQEVVFNINIGNLNLPLLDEDLIVHITQNRRWDNAKLNIKPRFIDARTLYFDHVNGENAFGGGNQYRMLDLKSLIGIRDPVMAFEEQKGKWKALLRPEVPRANAPYRDVPDLNGKCFYFRGQNYTRSMDEDYIETQFIFAPPAPLGSGDMYLIGGMTNGHLDSRFKMTYDSGSQAYLLSVPLKQGLYNYLYAWVPRSKKQAELTFTEGDIAQTENEYQIYVYARSNGDIAHRLIGYTELGSR